MGFGAESPEWYVYTEVFLSTLLSIQEAVQLPLDVFEGVSAQVVGLSSLPQPAMLQLLSLSVCSPLPQRGRENNKSVFKENSSQGTSDSLLRAEFEVQALIFLHKQNKQFRICRFSFFFHAHRPLLSANLSLIGIAFKIIL